MACSTLLDVVIVGGGPAGLSCATGLARVLHTAVVFDSGVYRNRYTKYMHAVPSWDHRDPADFRAAIRDDILARYQTISFENVGIESITKGVDNSFQSIDTSGREWRSKKIMLATGVEDLNPGIDGWESCWAKGIFHCLFCKGYESRGGRSAGVLAINDLAAPPAAIHFARNAGQLAERVTLYTHGQQETASALGAALNEFDKSRMEVDDRKIMKVSMVDVENSSDIELTFADGSTKVERFVAYKPQSKLNGAWVEMLGLEVTAQGDLVVNMFGETSVKGVFAAGDNATPIKSVTAAIYGGTMAGAGLSASIEAEYRLERL